ncbi:hypothetical protein L7F22_031675 [Adiantum nelumboides]|nr:hypothetical protein [Adiantum nelumboides]
MGGRVRACPSAPFHACEPDMVLASYPNLHHGLCGPNSLVDMRRAVVRLRLFHVLTGPFVMGVNWGRWRNNCLRVGPHLQQQQQSGLGSVLVLRGSIAGYEALPGFKLFIDALSFGR